MPGERTLAPTVAPKSLLLPVTAVVLLVAACSSDGDDDATTPTTVRTGGCPVAAAVVAEAVGHDVVVERRSSGRGSCAYVGVVGARVEVALRTVEDAAALQEVRDDVESRAGPVADLPGGLVDGAAQGWVAVVGRAVQVAAVRDEQLVLVAVADPALDADAARRVAADLAGEALSG
jgi:hypothetical protein